MLRVATGTGEACGAETFQELAEQLTREVRGLTIRVPTYQGVDLEKHKALRRRGHAPMTWIFGVDFKHEEACSVRLKGQRL